MFECLRQTLRFVFDLKRTKIDDLRVALQCCFFSTSVSVPFRAVRPYRGGGVADATYLHLHAVHQRLFAYYASFSTWRARSELVSGFATFVTLIYVFKSVIGNCQVAIPHFRCNILYYYYYCCCCLLLLNSPLVCRISVSFGLFYCLVFTLTEDIDAVRLFRQHSKCFV